MTTLGWFFIILMAVATAISLSIAWKASPPVDLRGILARLALSLRRVPAFQEHSGHHRPATVPVSLLSEEETTAHADAMWEASEPYLPPPPPDPYGWMAGPQDGPVYRTLASYMQAGRPVEIPQTPDRPPWMITTNALDAVPATDEGTLAMYHGRHSRRDDRAGQDNVQTWRAPGFGTDRCEADVLAAEQALPFPYDPDCDNCAGTPGCGSERVFYKWSGMLLTMCPRCYVNTFGGEPDPAQVHTVTDALAAEAGAQPVMLP